MQTKKLKNKYDIQSVVAALKASRPHSPIPFYRDWMTNVFNDVLIHLGELESGFVCKTIPLTPTHQKFSFLNEKAAFRSFKNVSLIEIKDLEIGILRKLFLGGVVSSVPSGVLEIWDYVLENHCEIKTQLSASDDLNLYLLDSFVSRVMEISQTTKKDSTQTKVDGRINAEFRINNLQAIHSFYENKCKKIVELCGEDLIFLSEKWIAIKTDQGLVSSIKEGLERIISCQELVAEELFVINQNTFVAKSGDRLINTGFRNW